MTYPASARSRYVSRGFVGTFCFRQELDSVRNGLWRKCREHRSYGKVVCVWMLEAVFFFFFFSWLSVLRRRWLFGPICGCVASAVKIVYEQMTVCVCSVFFSSHPRKRRGGRCDHTCSPSTRLMSKFSFSNIANNRYLQFFSSLNDWRRMSRAFWIMEKYAWMDSLISSVGDINQR